MQETVTKTVVMIGVALPAAWQAALTQAGFTLQQAQTPTAAAIHLLKDAQAICICPPNLHLLLPGAARTQRWIAWVNTDAGQAFALRLGAFATLRTETAAKPCLLPLEAAFAPFQLAAPDEPLHSAFPTLLLDRYQRIMWANPALEALLLAPPNLVGRHLSVLLPAPPPDSLPLAAEMEWQTSLITTTGEVTPIHAATLDHPTFHGAVLLTCYNLRPHHEALQQITTVMEEGAHALAQTTAVTPQPPETEFDAPRAILKTIYHALPGVTHALYLLKKDEALTLIFASPVTPRAIPFAHILGKPLADIRFPLRYLPQLQALLTQTDPLQIPADHLSEFSNGLISKTQSKLLQKVYRYQSAVLQPLSRAPGASGFLLVMLKRPALTPTEINLLKYLSAIAASELEQVHLNAQIQHQQRQIAALHAVGVRVSRSLELAKVMQYAVETIAEVLAVEASAISLIEPETGDLVIRAQCGLHKFAHAPVRIPKGRGIAWETLTAKTLRLIESWDDEPRLAIPEFREERVRTTVMVPMLIGQESVGVLSAMSRIPRTFTAEELNLLKGLADQVAIALSNARLHEETRRQTHERTFLFNSAVAIAPLQDLGAIAAEALAQTLAFLEWDSGAFLLEDPESGALIPKAHHGEILPLPAIQSNVRESSSEPGAPSAHRVTQVVHLETWPRTMIQVPINAGNRRMGWLVLGHPQWMDMPHHTQEVLTTAGNYLGIVIENVQLYREMQTREKRTQALYQITRTMTGTDRRKLLEQTLAELHQGIPYEIGCAALPAHALGMIYLRVPTPPERLHEIKTRLHSTLQALGAAQPPLPTEIPLLTHVDEIQEALEPQHLLSYLEAPIIQDDRPVGALLLARRQPFQLSEQRIVFIVAYQLGKVMAAIPQPNILATAERNATDALRRELNNPLTFIRSYGEMLLEGELGSLTAQQKEAVAVILEQAQALSRLAL